MYIPFNTKRKSAYPETDTLGFLLKESKVYVMDNHLAAPWCWIKECDVNSSYSFIHIDRHHDLVRNGLCDISSYELIADNSISLDTYLSLGWCAPGTEISIPCFRWDSYITKCFDFYPKWFERTLFLINQSVDIQTLNETKGLNFESTRFPKAFSRLKSFLGDNCRKCIVNLDIDFFFRGEDFGNNDRINIKKMYSERTIHSISNLICTYWDNIKVLTIALSPECCGGISNAISVLRNLMKNINKLNSSTLLDEVCLYYGSNL